MSNELKLNQVPVVTTSVNLLDFDVLLLLKSFKGSSSLIAIHNMNFKV